MRPQRHITKNIKEKNNRLFNRLQFTNKVTQKEAINIKQEENNKDKQSETMDNVDMKQVDALLHNEEPKLPKRKVKVEKKDRGLYERTENSRVILTEDNKMLLND